MIEIDDSGWGCMIGGVLIAGLRRETGEFHVAEIPVEHFQPPKFMQKSYLAAAAEATRQVLASLNSPLDEPVHICSGYVHQGTHAWLGSSGRKWQIVKIGGALQRLIENALAEYLRKLGFVFDGSTEKYGSLFYKSVEWLKDGNVNAPCMNPEKIKVAKTGWGTFPFYRDYPYHEARELAAAFKRTRSRSRFQRWRGGYDYGE